MAKPLVVCLVVALAFQASAQTNRPSPRQFKAELAEYFAKGSDLSRFAPDGMSEDLVKLLDQIKYVQAGREPGDEKETHITFVRSVARRLGAQQDKAVALYGDRVRPARTSTAAQRELDARAAIASDVRLNPGISAEKKARLNRDLVKTSEYLRLGMNGDASFVGGPAAPPIEIRAQLVYQDSGKISYNPDGTRNWFASLPRVQPYPFTTTPTPAPQTDPAALSSLPSAMNRIVYSLAQLSSFIDVKRGADVAYEAINGVLQEGKKAVHRCYNFVKQALIDAGVIDAPNPQSTAAIGLRPAAAEMFNTDVAKDPKTLDRLGYRRAKMGGLKDPAEIPLGTIFIYGKKCGFEYYDKKAGNFVDHGHAELSVTREKYEEARRRKATFNIRPLDPVDVPACHYTCAGRSVAYLNTKGAGDNACLRMYVPVKSS